MILLVDTTIYRHKFLRKLRTYLERRGHEYKLVRNLEELRALEPLPPGSRFVVSGSELRIHGPLPPPLVALLDHILAGRHSRSTPVLGICFGAQYLARHLGLHVLEGSTEVCQRVPIPELGIRPWFCLHDTVTIPYGTSPIRVIGTAALGPDGPTIAVFCHRSRPWFGMLFHPEALVSTYPLLDAFLS